MFIMPVSEDERDRVHVKDDAINLKSYGLPLIFWGYLAAALSVIFLLFIAIKEPMFKMMRSDDEINIFMAYVVFLTIIGIPLVTLGFYFYEKTITKKQNTLTITHKVFWLPLLQKKYELQNSNSFLIDHYLDSPNMAKIHGDKEMRAFQNQGHYQLFLIDKEDKHVLLDRHSRKADLKKIIELLSKY